MEFPRLVYKSADDHRVAETQEELDTLCKEGWFASVPDAIEGKHEVIAEPTVDEAVDEAVDETVEPTRSELEAKAKELNLKFTKRTTDKKLGQMITDALES